MSEQLADKIVEMIGDAAALYHRLIILAAPSGSGKTQTLRAVQERTGASIVNVGLELSREMLELTERQRVLKMPTLLGKLVLDRGEEVVLLDNTEILFDVTLKQDPLRLVQGLSRSKTLVVSWNGQVENEHLIYAAPDHPEYRSYLTNDLLIISPDTAEAL